MNIDIKQLKAECDEEIAQAYRAGWRTGYLNIATKNPHVPGRVADAWSEGCDAGYAAYRAEQKAKEQQP